MAVENGTGVDFRHHGCDVYEQGGKGNVVTPFSHVSGQCARHVDRDVSRLVQPSFENALSGCRVAAILQYSGLAGPVIDRQAPFEDEQHRRRQISAENLVYFINHAKESGYRASHVEPQDDYERKMVELYSLYEDQCQREGVVDFAELLLRSYELLERNQTLREHYQDRFRHILVDEFQDTNNLQYKWLKLLAGNDSSIFAVGDDDQSIYAFRGANVGNMLSFQQDFNVQNLIRLEQNYRSHGNILEAANTLIAHNRNRLGKNLHTDAGEGEPDPDL